MLRDWSETGHSCRLGHLGSELVYWATVFGASLLGATGWDRMMSPHDIFFLLSLLHSVTHHNLNSWELHVSNCACHKLCDNEGRAPLAGTILHGFTLAQSGMVWLNIQTCDSFSALHCSVFHLIIFNF